MKRAFSFIRSYRYILLFILFFLQLLLIVWSQWGILFQRYDALYWKDRFEHSQWQLPLSQRILGDDGLFEYVGYTLVHGADPSLVNAETPPVAKYLLGASIVLFGSPLVYSFLIGLGSLVVFFFLCKRFLKHTALSLACTLVLFLDPLFFSQLRGGWTDSTQLFFLLLHFLLLFSLPKQKSWKQYIFVVGSAVSLGLFAQSKTPLLLPVILLADVLYLFHYSIISVGVFLGSFVIGDLLPYAYYFRLHNSLGDFIRLQKYIISFYGKSKLHVHRDAFWTTIFFGKFPDIVSGVWGTVKEWQILWPIALILGTMQAVRLFASKHMSRESAVVILFLFCSIVIFSFIPFYPRYFLILLPFFYLLSFQFFAQFRQHLLATILLIVIFSYGVINTQLYFHQNPQDTVSSFSYNFSRGYFQDIYQENTTTGLHHTVSREKFFSLTHTAFSQAQIRAVSISTQSVNAPFFATRVTFPLSITYYTQHLGTFTRQKELHLVKDNNQWKVVWDWNLLLDMFVPGDILETTVLPGKRGSIIDQKGNILASDTNGFLISVIPDKIDTTREQDMLKLFQKFSGKKAVHLQNAYLENSLPSEQVPVFTNFVELSTSDEQQLAYFPGVSFEPTTVRVYNNYPISTITNTAYTECCSRIYTSWSYHGTSGLEKQFDEQLHGQDGGSLLLLNAEGKTIQTLIQKESKNGQDVVTPL